MVCPRIRDRSYERRVRPAPCSRAVHLRAASRGDRPRTAELYALEPTALRVAWAPPASDGGQAVVRYLVQWDVSEDFRNIKTSGYEASVAATPGAETECYDIEIAAVSASVPRFVRVAAYNGYDYSPFAATSPSSAVGTVRTPGPPRAPTLDVTSGVGLQVEWGAPSATPVLVRQSASAL